MALTPANLSTMVTIGTAVEVETPASQPSRTYAVNWQTGQGVRLCGHHRRPRTGNLQDYFRTERICPPDLQLELWL